MMRIKNPIKISGREGAYPLLSKYGWLIHCLFWLLMFGFPFIFINSRSSELITWEAYSGFVVMLVSTMFVFYANYIYLVPRFLFRKQTLFFILANVLLIVVTAFLVHWVMESLPHDKLPPPQRHGPPLSAEEMNLRLLFGNITRFIFTVTISVALRMTIGWYMVDAQRKELEKSRAEAELQNLKSQLNPHFLFNTLNNIYSLIAISQERAQEVVHDLSRLLRYVMYDSSQPFVPLEKELDFLRNYIELMRIRLPGHVRVDSYVSVDDPQIAIAPLLFISLIENAFKHGVSDRVPSFIGFDIRQKGKEITCVILNSHFPKTPDDKSGSGIGLPNLHKRLELLYPGRFELQCGREGDNYRAYLSIMLTDQTNKV